MYREMAETETDPQKPVRYNNRFRESEAVIFCDLKRRLTFVYNTLYA